MRRVVITGVLLGLACGGGSTQTDVRSTGPTSFRGISATFSLLDAFQVTETGALGDAIPVTVFEVGISDFPRSCVGSDAGIPAGRHGWLGVSIEKPKPDAVGPGTYVVAGDFSGTTTTVSASFFPYEASCDGFPVPGMTGQIRLAHVDETSAEGVVDLTLDDGTRLEGAFAATRCPPPPGIGPLPDGGDPTFPEPEICPWATQR